jgi:hypothetical protein
MVALMVVDVVVEVEVLILPEELVPLEFLVVPVVMEYLGLMVIYIHAVQVEVEERQ